MECRFSMCSCLTAAGSGPNLPLVDVLPVAGLHSAARRGDSAFFNRSLNLNISPPCFIADYEHHAIDVRGERHSVIVRAIPSHREQSGNQLLGDERADRKRAMGPIALLAVDH